MRSWKIGTAFIAPSPLTELQRAEYIVMDNTQTAPRQSSGRRPLDALLGSRDAYFTDVSLRIPSCCVDFLLGHRGSNVRIIAKTSKTKIHVDLNNSLNRFSVHIRGFAEQILLAKQKIEFLLSEYLEQDLIDQ
jgi:hypothetical protein